MPRKEHAGLTEQRKVSLHRLEDAQVLFDGGRWRGAMYMAGYAVECRLKYKLMRQWKCFKIEQLEKLLTEKGIRQGVYTHNLEKLLKLAGGIDRLKANTMVARQFFDHVNVWKPAWRYNPDLASRDEANTMLTATRGVVQWVENNL